MDVHIFQFLEREFSYTIINNQQRSIIKYCIIWAPYLMMITIFLGYGKLEVILLKLTTVQDLQSTNLLIESELTDDVKNSMVILHSIEFVAILAATDLALVKQISNSMILTSLIKTICAIIFLIAICDSELYVVTQIKIHISAMGIEVCPPLQLNSPKKED